MSSDAQIWMKELKDAGWVRLSLTAYQAPCKCIYRGPALAWRVLKLREERVEDGLKECPNHED